MSVPDYASEFLVGLWKRVLIDSRSKQQQQNSDLEKE